MNYANIEAILRRARQTLPLPKDGSIERDHVLKDNICPDCGEVLSTWTIKRCKDRLCWECHKREFWPVSKELRSLDFNPAHLVHLILPACPIPLRQVHQKPIVALKKAISTVIRQAWFAKAVMGGFYIIEIDVVEIGVSHDLGIRPHVHM